MLNYDTTENLILVAGCFVEVERVAMYEDRTIEIKYLHNFSSGEKVSFYHQQRARKKAAREYAETWHHLTGSTNAIPVVNYEPQNSSALEIKYILNRITANDPRDTTFELGRLDSVSNADRLALEIAKAFCTNSTCRKVVLKNIGLTDKGLLPILSVLQRKKLVLLDIAGNKFTDESFRVIEGVLSNPKTEWSQVNLGSIRMSPERATSLSQYSNVVFQNWSPVGGKIDQRT